MTPDKMPLRSVKIPDDIWTAAQDRAKAEGTTVSEVIRKALKRYGNKPRRAKPMTFEELQDFFAQQSKARR